MWGVSLSVSTPTPGGFSRKEDMRHTIITLALVIEENQHSTVNKEAVVISRLERKSILLISYFQKLESCYLPLHNAHLL